MVDSMDQAVGKLLEAVEKRPDSTNTLVLFFSDNGGVPKVGSNAPWRGWKLTVYEGGTRVCAAIRWPAGGLTGGKEFGGRIGYIDVLPTLLAAAGAAIPANLDGVNFLPALRGEKPLNSRLWFSYIHQGKDAHASVHDGKWKLVAHGDFFAPSGVPELELYDLEKDPGETNDVAKANPETIKVLRKALVDFGKLRTTEGEDYAAGRANFHAPKDWKITE
jgi:arylsulfatase A-like enzyme